MKQQTYDVAIIGYGPVGALLANLLARDGVRTIVLERDREIYRLPRAVHFDHEIMRIFQSIGIANRLIDDTAPLEGCEFLNADHKLLFRFDLSQETTHQGWRQDYMFHQPGLETVLRAALAEREDATVKLEHEVTEVRELDGHVEIAVQDKVSGERTTVCSRYAVGCDGANSFVRRSAGLKLDDLEFDEPWLVVDATIARPRRELGLSGPMIQFCDPSRPVTFVPVVGPHIRWEFMLRPGETKEEMLRPERVDELISKWVDPREVEVIRTAVYDFHAVVAAQWNTRRIFLAGDSAHQMPPFLGQGMCSGIRDAANLAWKLGLVLRGVAAESILATYQVEREPHVRQIVEIAIATGRIICTQDPRVAAARDADLLARLDRAPETLSMPALSKGLLQLGSDLAGKLGLQTYVCGRDGARALLDDVVGPGFVLLSKQELDALSAPAQRVLERIRGWHVEMGADFDRDGAYRGWFDRHGCEAVLVRPDHVVFGATSGSDASSTLLEDLGRRLLR
jgi:3-(3-hydroxy-phenyl)propionate hydroxylase